MTEQSNDWFERLTNWFESKIHNPLRSTLLGRIFIILTLPIWGSIGATFVLLLFIVVFLGYYSIYRPFVWVKTGKWLPEL